MTKNFTKRTYDNSFFESTKPTKLTETRKLKLHTEGWGLLSDYYLESVKINKNNQGGMLSAATLKISDRSGQTTCVVKGPTVGLLFGLQPSEWLEVEKLNSWSQQLFFRHFKNGLKTTFSYEQKLFYNFCLSNQRNEVLVAVFQRCVNMRNTEKNDAVLEVFELKKCNDYFLDLYSESLKSSLASQ